MGLSVFISYARENGTKAKKLYKALKSKQLEPWIDTENLLPGMKWKPAIRKAIRESDYFIALLSNQSVSEDGYVLDETKEAIEVYKEFPDDRIFLIPVRLDNCKLPFTELNDITYVDFFPAREWNTGFEKVMRVFSNHEPKGNTLLSKIEGISNVVPFKKTIANVNPIKSEIKTDTFHYRVGLVDLNTNSVEVDLLCSKLNDAQSFFKFTKCNLPSVNKANQEFNGLTNLAIHEIPPSWYKKPETLDVDLIFCMTKYPLAFQKDGYEMSNFFAVDSGQDERFMFISTDSLEEFTKEADKSFEKGTLQIILSMLTAYFVELDCHYTTKGCPMDFCENRQDLIKGLKKGKFCSSCDKKIKNSEYGKSLYAILNIDI